MMILADESVDMQIVTRLRQDGLIVYYVAEMEPGLTDIEVIQLAKDKMTLLLTADKDFGELIYRQKFQISSIVLIRLAGINSMKKAEIVSETLKNHSNDLKNSFAVISPLSVRIRKLKLSEG